MPQLPPGPDAPATIQAIAYHRDPLGVLRRARARYGPVFTLRFPLKDPLVMVAVPEALDELLHADPARAHAGAARRGVLPQASPASPFGGDGQAHQSSRGRMWPGFAPQRIESLQSGIAALAGAHVSRWPVNRPFRLLEAMRTLCTEITVGLVLGVEDPERRRRLLAAIRRMLNTPGNPPLPLPGGTEGPFGVAGRLGDAEFARRSRPVRRILAGALTAERDSPSGEGVLAAMISSDPPLDDAAIIDQLLIVLMAAQEPPSIALSNVVYELAARPEVLDLFLGDVSSRRSIVAEVLRLRPSASAALRQITEPWEIGGHSLPAGTTVACPSPLLHRDPTAFSDADSFRSDRFTDGTPAGAPYLPFGGGARRCIGEALAEAEFRAVLPALLERRRFRRAWPREERMVVRATVLVPQRSALVTAT